MLTYKKIIGVTTYGVRIDIGVDASRILPPGRRYRYEQPVIYQLKDEERENGRIRAKTLKQLEERIKNTQLFINQGKLEAIYDCTKFSGTILKF